VKKRIQQSTIALLLLGLPLLALAGSGVAAVTTEILSVTNDGTPRSTDDRHTWSPSTISNDGRYAVFVSTAHLTGDDVDPDPYRPADIFVRDRVAGTTKLLTPPGFYGTASTLPFSVNAISGDGNYVALMARRYENGTYFDNLLLVERASGAVEVVKEGVTASQFAVDYDGDVYYFDDYNVYTGGVHIRKYDRQTKTTTELYTSTAKYGPRYRLSVNDAGTLVCFCESEGGDLASGSIYLLEVATGNRTLVSVAADGSPAVPFSVHAKISKSGKYVIFHSRAANIGQIPYPTSIWNLFLYDVEAQTVEKVDFIHPQYGYLYPTEHLYNMAIADVSDDGRYIAAVLTTPEYKSHQYGAILDRQTGTVSFLPDGAPKENMLYPVLTPDGRYLVSTGVTPTVRGVFVLLYDLFADGRDYVVEAGVDQVLEQDSAAGAYATLQGTLVEGNCSEGLFQWSWAEGMATGDNPIVQLPAGTTVVTLDWSGCGATATDSLSVTVQDTTAPTVEATIGGEAGQNGWYRSPLVAALLADDAGSGVREIRYRLDGATEAVDPGVSATLPVTAEGTHTLAFSAIDNAGNAAAEQSVSLRIDTTAPRTDVAPVGQADKNGLFVSEVNVALTAADATSGVQQLAYRVNGAPWQVASAAAASLLLTEDGSYRIDYYALDAAGNAEAQQSLLLSIDKTQLAPTLVEGIRDIVPTIPLEAFVSNNPNYASKLTMEIDKVLTRLAGIDDTLTSAEKIQEYEWAKKMLVGKLLDEFERMIDEPAVLQPIAAQIAKAAAAIDVQIARLRAEL